jgi:hypothetical protein
MNIKSLILGSAVSALAATGAKAADAIIIAEPEPVEYVRVCDVYGAGFFYIPGTETCLSISGYVFHQVGATSSDNYVGVITPGTPPSIDGNGNFVPGTDPVTGVIGNDTPSWSGATNNRPDRFTNWTRARVNFDARSETQYGTLRSYIRVQADFIENNYNQDGNGVIDQAWLSLGGFLAGYTESAFHNSNLVGSLTNGTGFSWDPTAYSYSQRQLIQYNFSGANGFFGIVSLENDPDDLSDYVPDFVGKVGIQQGWGAAWLTVGVDTDSAWTGDTEYAVKAGLHYNIPGAPGSAFRLVGHYNSDANTYQQGGPAATGVFFSSDWSVYAGYRHQFNPQVAAWIGGAYYDDVAYLSGVDGYHVESGLTWTPVTNFEVRAEAVYTKVDGLDGTVSGFLRFTRSF